jgi:hypothetical protein
MALAIDYSHLYDVTVDLPIEFPSREKILRATKDSSVFSLFPLKYGPYLIKLAGANAEVTAFELGNHQFCFTRCPYGLKGVSKNLHKMLTDFLGAYLWKGVIVLADLVIVYSKEAEEHVELMEKLTAVFKKHNIALCPSRTKILQTSLRIDDSLVLGSESSVESTSSSDPNAGSDSDSEFDSMPGLVPIPASQGAPSSFLPPDPAPKSQKSKKKKGPTTGGAKKTSSKKNQSRRKN